MSNYTATDTGGNEFEGALKPLIKRGAAHIREQTSKGRNCGWQIRRNSDGAIATFKSSLPDLFDAGYSVEQIEKEFLEWTE